MKKGMMMKVIMSGGSDKEIDEKFNDEGKDYAILISGSSPKPK